MAREFKSSRSLSPRALEKCRRGPFTVRVWKDHDGNIGACVLIPTYAGDAPIIYLDPDGNHLTTFHIFGPEEETTAAAAVVQELRARFPVEGILPDPPPG